MNRFFSIFVSFFLLAVTLSWDAPTARTDGSAMGPDEIDRYMIHCGLEPGQYTSSFNVGNVLTSRVSDLLPGYGSYYCAATVFDTWNQQSNYSTEVFFVHRPAAPGAPINLRIAF